MKKESLVGIVLQARMVAEIFQNECKGYLEHEKFNFSNFRITNISDLYGRFIEYQYERYLKEKIEISTKLSEGSRTLLTRSYTKAYGDLALKSLFSKDQIQEFPSEENFLEEELQDIGLVKTLKDDGTADFLHLTYAEYFVADLLVDALRKEKDHPKYRAVNNFLRMQIFRDHNKVVHDFIENKIKKESDSNLSSKWKAIQNCNLLKVVKTKVELQPQKSISGPDHLNPPDDALSKKSLSKLQKEAEECMNWKDNGYYYNGDTRLINKLFQKFLGETDIEVLKTTLEFLLKANGKSYLGLQNQEFLRENNIDRAIEHYFTEVKKKGTISSLPNNLRNDCLKVKINNEKVFTKLEKILENPTNNREKYLKKLIHLLIPKTITSIEILKESNNLCSSLDIVYPNIIDDVKSYIKSTEDTKKKYAKRIINSLKDINCGNCGCINHELEDSSDLKSLQSFFIDILYHPSVIACAKSSINEIYKDKGLTWLERKGVLISRVLEILTPEMSERFNSVLGGETDGGTKIYSDGIFVDLINYIVNRVEVEELPQVNKLSFLKMLVRFVGFSVEENRKLPFTSEQLKTTLELVKGILNEQRKTTIAVSESIGYLFILGKAGLKLIDAKKELLVIDPAGEFEYKLSSDYINQIIDLIKWRSEHPNQSKSEFLEKCYEILELRKNNLRRRGSESSLQESRRFKAEDCLPKRSKREAESECQFTWKDVDEFNEEKDEKRDFSKIKIDGERFVSYIKDLPEEKQSQLIQLASGVKVTGESQSLVNKLISNQKVMSHLSRVGRISGMTMHGMMAKNVLVDFLNGDYQGVAVNVGFIAGGQGFARVAEAASLKGLKLAEEGKLLVGSSLRAASPFLARGTSAFVIYDLVNQVKAFKNGTEEALVSVVGDSIYLGVDAAEIGIEVAEAFEILEGVSSVTGPIGAAIGAVVFVGTDIYMAVKRVDKIDQIIHLKGNEKFIEGLRAFIGMQPEQNIEELLEEKQLYNQLVNQGLEYLQQHSDIKRYVFPSGRTVKDSCLNIPYDTTECVRTLGLDGGRCLEKRIVTKYYYKCTSKFEADLDNEVFLDRETHEIKWSRARPNDPSGGKVFCLPQGDYEPAPSYGSYLCESAVGITDLNRNKTGNYTLINLGEGRDYARGFLNSPNVFVVNNGHKQYQGGSKDDVFVLQGDSINGYLYGEGGINTLDLAGFALKAKNIDVVLDRGDIIYGNHHIFKAYGIEKVFGRRAKAERIFGKCDTQFVDGKGGAEDRSDVVIIESDSCAYEMQIVVRPNTVIRNHALKGDFHYTVPYGSGNAAVNFIDTTGVLNVNNTFAFEYEPVEIKNIDVRNINVLDKTSHIITFNFAPMSDKEFNITISGASNPSYRLGNNAEIKVGNNGNLYMLENTNKSVDEIIREYLVVANRLNKMSFFIQSLLSNETVVIGSGNHEVMHNNPLHKSHMVGNGGENVYVIDSETDNVLEVIIHDVDEENSIDTIDLRNVVKKAKGNFELQVVKSENDLLLRATVEKHEYFTVRLKDGVERYNKAHVIVENVPMRISVDKDEWSLKPQPLMFDKDKEVIVIADQDVEKGIELITPRKGGNYTFVRSNSNDLMITNAFDFSITKNDLCSITLSRFYETPKMATLSIKFADKEVVLKDHQEEISTARDVNVVKKEHKDQVYNDVFNHAKSSPEVMMLSNQPVTHRHRHSRHTRHRRSTTSSSTRPTGWINDLLGWVKSSVSGLLGSKSKETSSTSGPISQVDAPIDVNGTIMLLDVLVRKVTGQKYIFTSDQSISSLEAQGYALNITEKFEKVVEQAGLKSGVSIHRLNIDYMGMQKEITRKVMSGKFDDISGILSSYVEKACSGIEALSPKKFDKFMAQFNKGLLNQSIEQILHNGDDRLEVDGTKQMSLEPQSCLSNASVQGHLIQNKVKLIS